MRRLSFAVAPASSATSAAPMRSGSRSARLAATRPAANRPLNAAEIAPYAASGRCCALWPAVGSALGIDDPQVLRQRRDDLAAVVGDDDEVLDPHADRAGHIDPRLDRDDVARLQRVLPLLGEPRPLVDLEPDPVSEAVAEVLGVARVVDDRARDRVDLPAGRARPHRGEGGLLRAQHEVVDIAVARVDLAAGPERARA